jgi:hypothetical protein
MQDLSRVTGNPQSFKIRGEEITLTEASFEAYGRLQAECLKAKRRAMVEPVTQTADLLPPDEYKRQLDRAMAEAQKVRFITDAEFHEWAASQDGAVTFLWVLLDLQHPAKQYTKEEVFKSLIEAAAADVDPASLVHALGGVDDSGNSTGPTLP